MVQGEVVEERLAGDGGELGGEGNQAGLALGGGEGGHGGETGGKRWRKQDKGRMGRGRTMDIGRRTMEMGRRVRGEPGDRDDRP